VPMRAAHAVKRTLPEVTRPAPTRPISWLKGLRRLRVRYDRLAVMIDAWATLAASVGCFRILHHDAM